MFFPLPAASLPPPPAAAAPSWTQHVSPDGRVYFYNEKTKESSWEKPDELKSRNERLLSQCPWKEYQTDTGKTYYHNVITKESAWTVPAELQELKTKVEQEQLAEKGGGGGGGGSAPAAALSAIQLPPDENARPATSLSPREDSNLSYANDDSKLSAGNSVRSLDSPADRTPASKESADPARAAPASGGNSNSALSSLAGQTPSTASPAPAKDLVEIFRELLRDRHVSSNVTWEVALKSISADPRYELFRHHAERKQMFNAYKTQKAKEEREEQRLRAKRAKENLEKHLQTTKLMNASIKFRQACEFFRENELWKAVPEPDRREIFEDTIKVLAEREREQAKALRKRNMRVLSDILDSMPAITQRVSWQEAQQLLLDNPAFAGDAALLGMDKEDALVIFEGHIRQLEAEEEEERRRERKRTGRQQRKNREQFVELLDELHAQGKLTSISKWSQLYQEISADTRFAAILAAPCTGSSPLDLFKFYVEELKARYEDERTLIKQLLKERGFRIDASTGYEQFATVLSEDQRSGKLDAGNVRMVYERLVDRAKELDRDQQRELNRQRRKLEMQFMGLLARLQPAIDETSEWSTVRPLIETDEVFDKVPTDEERIAIFKAYQRSLEESCSHHHGKARKQRAKKRTKRTRHDSSDSSGAESEPMELEDGELDQPTAPAGAQSPASSSSSGSDDDASNGGAVSPPARAAISPAPRAASPDSDSERKADESENPDDLEELEKQRLMLLQQLAAHR